jgi:hypothetical protein
MTPTEKPKSMEIEPGQKVEVDMFQPQDAEGVAALFRAIYGEGYPVKTYYDPVLLREENQAGRTISSVARTPKGDIVGHNALYQSAPSAKIYESGAGLVLPDYRTGSLFTRLVEHGYRIAAPQFEVDALFGEPVCNHVFSQKLTHSQGWVTRALEVDLMPAAAYTKEKSASGRVAAFLDFAILKPMPHTVYIPEAYAAVFEFLYEGLDDERQIKTSIEPPPQEIASKITPQFFEFAQVARLTVLEAGADFSSCLLAVEEEAGARDIKVIQVWLPLSLAWIGSLVDAMREMGYFLGGLLPRWFGQDGMLMQKIKHTPHWDGIKLAHTRAHQLLDIVKEDWSGAGNAS